MNKNKRPLISNRGMILVLAFFLNMLNPLSLRAFCDYEPDYWQESLPSKEIPNGFNSLLGDPIGGKALNDGFFKPFDDTMLKNMMDESDDPSNPNPYAFSLGAPVGDAMPVVLVLSFVYGLWLVYLRKKG